MSSRSAYQGSALSFLKALKAIVLDNVFKPGPLRFNEFGDVTIIRQFKAGQRSFSAVKTEIGVDLRPRIGDCRETRAL